MKAGLDFGALVAAHESSMEITETSDKGGGDSAQSPKLARIPSKEKESTEDEYDIPTLLSYTDHLVIFFCMNFMQHIFL